MSRNNTFVTSIYRKKTFTGLYTKWDSFTPRKYKINLIRTLTYRCYRICSSASLLQSALGDHRKLLLQNGYPQGIITYNVNDVLNRNRNKPRSPVSTVPKKDIIILLPYLGLQSNQISQRLKSCAYNLQIMCIQICKSCVYNRGGRVAEWLGCWTSSPWVPGSNPTLSTSWICFTAVPSNKSFGYACLPPVGFLKSIFVSVVT